jgi:hypothetical protein
VFKYAQLKIFLLLNGVPDETSDLQRALERFKLNRSRFTQVDVPRADAARVWQEARRNEAIAELTLGAAVVAMVAAVIACLRR